MRYTIFFLSIISLFFHSCSKHDDLEQFDTYGEMAALAVFNTVPSSLDMEVFIEGKKLKAANEKLPFGKYLPYKSVFSGTMDIKIVSSYKGGQDTYNGTVNLYAGKVYSLFVNKEEKVTATLFEDNIIKPRPGFAKIRLAHMSPNASPLSLSDGKGEPFFQNIKYKDVTPFVEMKSTSRLSLFIRPTGVSKVPQLDQNFLPDDQGIYTLLVTGYVDPENAAEEIGMQLVEHRLSFIYRLFPRLLCNSFLKRSLKSSTT